MQRANLGRVQAQGAIFTRAQLTGANFGDARVQRAFFGGASMQNTNFHSAQMDDASFGGAQLQGSNFNQAHMRETNLRAAQMAGSDFHYSLLIGTPAKPLSLENTNLNGATNHGGALRFVDAQRVVFDTATDFRNAFLDGSVAVNTAFQMQMASNSDRPCQWVRTVITDDTHFYALWHWWAEEKPKKEISEEWQVFAPADVQNIPAADLTLRRQYGIPDDCAWQTGPMPGAEE